MKQHLFLLMLLSFTITVSAQTSSFIGNFSYHDSESAEQLHVYEDHQFSWWFLSDATNVDGHGHWNEKNDTIHFVLDLPNSTARKSQKDNSDTFHLPEEMTAVMGHQGNMNRISRFRETKEALFQRFEPEPTAPDSIGEKYKGYFLSKNKMMETEVYLTADERFVVSKTITGQPEPTYQAGEFQIRNDTAYLTTAPYFDEIKTYGTNEKEITGGRLKVIVRSLDKSKIRFKWSNSSPGGSHFQEAHADEKLDDSTFADLIPKSDTLWVAYKSKTNVNVYTYIFDNPTFKDYNEILIMPGLEPDVMIDYPMYINKEGKIYSGGSKTENLFRLPMGGGLSDLVESPSLMPMIGDKLFYDIERRSVVTLKE